MNIYELDRMIARCKELGHIDLVTFYQAERVKLVARLTAGISNILSGGN